MNKIKNGHNILFLLVVLIISMAVTISFFVPNNNYVLARENLVGWASDALVDGALEELKAEQNINLKSKQYKYAEGSRSGKLDFITPDSFSSLPKSGLEHLNAYGQDVNRPKIDGAVYSSSLKLSPSTMAQSSFDDYADGYIIKLDKPPIATRIKEINKEIKNLQATLKPIKDTATRADIKNKIEDIKANRKQIQKQQKEAISKEQDDASKKIKSIAPSAKIKKKFSKSFNGLHVDIKEAEINVLEKSGYKIFPNKRVQAVLMDSVPYINADDVWKLDSDGNQCEATGKDCLTGKGVKIAIIDTGVDYTHPDLGGCFGSGDSHAEATLKIGGRDYKVVSSSDIGVKDFNIKVDISGDGVLPNFKLGINNQEVIGSEKEVIEKDDYLFLKDFGMLQYKGADKATADNPLLKFRKLKTANSIEQTYTNSSPLAKLKLGGYDYSVFTASDIAFNDFDINADLDHTGAIFDYGLGIIADENKDIVKDSNFYLLYYDGLLQYLGADKATNDNPVMRFKNLQTGELIEQSYAIVSSQGGGGEVGSNGSSGGNGGFGQGCKVEGGYDFVNNDADPMDDYGHGTHVAAIAAGNGVLKGVAPDATIYAYKVLNAWGSGTWEWVIEGIDRSLDPNNDDDLSDAADIISLSLGGFGDPDDPVSQAVDNAVQAGTIVVVAAGNSGPNYETIMSPGTAREAITVGATYKGFDDIAYFSSRGPVVWNDKSLIKPDVVAPGVGICAAEWDDAFSYAKCLDDNHVAISGTSMATPHVSGAAALLKQKNPDWGPQEIKAVVRNSAVPLSSDIFTQGYGRLDMLKAAQSPKPPVARLDPPQFNTKGKIGITGTAVADNFKEYTLYIGEGYNPSKFTKFYSSSKQVVESILYSGLNTEELNEGYNIIKLVVVDKNDSASIDQITIKVNNFEITSIGNSLNYIKRGMTKVKGNIFYSGVSKYRIEYSNDLNGKWRQLCSRNSILPGNVLCNVNVGSIKNSIYYFRLAVLKNNVWKTDDPVKVAVVQEMLDNWPVEISGFPRGHHIVSNLKGNAKSEQDSSVSNEIIVPHYGRCEANWCMGTSLIFLDSNAGYKKLELLSDGSHVRWDDMPSVYFDNDFKQNLITQFDYSFAYNRPRIIDKEGNIKYSWDSDNLTLYGLGFYGPSVIFDRNNDGNPEFYLNLISWQSNEIWTYGFDKKGNILKNFPVIIKKEENLPYSLALRSGVFLKYNDGYNLAMIAGSYDYSRNYGLSLDLYADIYSNDNNLVKRVRLFNDLSKSVWLRLSFAAAADLTNDGNSEMVIGYSIIDMDKFINNVYDTEAYKTYIIVIDSEGNIVAKTDEIKGYTINNIVIGDLGYETPSIVATLDDTWPTTFEGQRVMAFDNSAKILFDKHLSDYNDLVQGVTIGDVDDDRKSEIVINHRWRWYNKGPSGVQIFDSKGDLERKIVIPTLGEVDDYGGMSPILTDLNGDGKTDIVLESLFIPEGMINRIYNTRLYSIMLNKKFDNKKIDWSTILHDNQHTSIFDKATLKCIDSDDGKNYFVKGTVKGYDKPTGLYVTVSDTCEGSSGLNEYICKGIYGMETEYTCPNGCQDGACLSRGVCGDGKVNQPNEDCDTNDFAGKTCTSYGYIGGTLKCTSPCLVDTSGCIKSNCSSHKISISEVLNNDGKIAVSYGGIGVTDKVKAELIVVSKFSNTTGSCPIIGGWCSGAPEMDFLSCTVYTECTYPESKPDTMYNVKLTDLNCSSVYDQVEIKPIIIKCTDSDGGKDYYVKGITSKGAEKFEDECISFKDNSTILQEWYCASDEQVDYDKYQCPQSCIDGACVSPPTPPSNATNTSNG